MTRTWPRDDEPPTGLSDLDLLVLWAVWDEPDYVYMIRERIGPLLPGEEVVKTGTLYAGVKRLTRDGLVEQTGQAKDHHFPTRTYYVATDRGRGLFRREVSRRIAPERWTDPVRCRLRHNLRLATVLSPVLVGDLLRSREIKLREHAAHAAWEVEVMGRTGEDPAEVLEHSLEQRLLEAEAQWLAEVVARWPDEGWPEPLVRAS